MGRAPVADVSQLYRFKDITTVPSAKDLIDQVLSKTQRKTPTVVHPQYQISRIRSFYMRKVKFCQQTFHDKLASMLQQFPRLDDVHPFYADLCNVLYDRDHYKLALGQVNAVRGVVDTIAKEYVRLLKYADSPYKSKMLKRAALGRMCTTIKKLTKSLDYLEQVRQHLSRLPAINPFSRTLLLAGHPNVGKSSFMNALSNANVEVEPFPFTTKSPYVGHFDYDYQRWQVVDTPGVLDRPLSSRNTVELTAITSLAHLSATVLFLVDISESCGYTIEDQVKLYHSVKPLLAHKPVLVVLNKADLRTPESLSDAEKELIRSMENGVDFVKFATCSTLHKLGLDDAKNTACDMLVAVKAQKRQLTNRFGGAMEGLYVASVKVPANRPPCPAPLRPDAMADGVVPERILERDLMEAEGGPGVFIADDRKYWDLKNAEWKYDQLPEFYEGKNIADFIDPDIEAKLLALEAEEAALEAAWDATEEAPTADWAAYQEKLKEIFYEKEKRRISSSLKKKKGSVIMPRRALDVSELKACLEGLGIDSTGIVARIPEKPSSSKMFITGADAIALTAGDDSDDNHVDEADDDAMTDEVKKPSPSEAIKTKLRLFTLARRQDGIGELARKKALNPSRSAMSNTRVQRLAEKQKVLVDKRYRKPTKGAPRRDQIHEADRFIGTAKPKHLYSGKRGIGKTDRR